MNFAKFSKKSLNSDKKSPLRVAFQRSPKNSQNQSESKMTGKFFVSKLSPKNDEKRNSKNSTKFSNSSKKKDETKTKNEQKLVILPRKDINHSRNFLSKKTSKEKFSPSKVSLENTKKLQ